MLRPAPLMCETDLSTLLLRTRAFSCKPRDRCLPIVGTSPPCRVRLVEGGEGKEPRANMADDPVTGNGFVFEDLGV